MSVEQHLSHAPSKTHIERYGQWLSTESEYSAFIAGALQELFDKYASLQAENRLQICSLNPTEDNPLGLSNSWEEVVQAVIDLCWTLAVSTNFWMPANGEAKLIDDRRKLLLLAIADEMVTAQKTKHRDIALARSWWWQQQVDAGTQLAEPPAHKLFPIGEQNIEYLQAKIDRQRQLWAVARMLVMVGGTTFSGVVNYRVNHAQDAEKLEYESQFSFGSKQNEAIISSKNNREIAEAHKQQFLDIPEIVELERARVHIQQLLDLHAASSFIQPEVWITTLENQQFSELFNCQAMVSQGKVILPAYDYSQRWRWLLLHEELHTVYSLATGYLWGALDEAYIESKTSMPNVYAHERYLLAIIELLCQSYINRSGLPVAFDRLLMDTALARKQNRFDSVSEQLLHSLLLQLVGVGGLLEIAMAHNSNTTYSKQILEQLQYPLHAAHKMMEHYNQLHSGPHATLYAELSTRQEAIDFHEGLTRWAGRKTPYTTAYDGKPFEQAEQLSSAEFGRVLHQEELRLQLHFEGLAIDAEAPFSSQLGQAVDYKKWLRLLQLWYWREHKVVLPIRVLGDPESLLHDTFLKVAELILQTSSHAVVYYSQGLPGIFNLEDIFQGKASELDAASLSIEAWEFICDCVEHLTLMSGERLVPVYQTLLAHLTLIVTCGFEYYLVQDEKDGTVFYRIALIDPGDEPGSEAADMPITEINWVLAKHNRLFAEHDGDWQAVATAMQAQLEEIRRVSLGR